MDKASADRSTIYLIPYPKRCESTEGELYFSSRPPIIDCPLNDPGLDDAAAELKELIISAAETLPAVESTTVPVITLAYCDAIAHSQGYEVRITRTGVTVTAKTAIGLFYGMQTLIQIARQYGRAWPCLHIMDAPDYLRRGFYHDVSRGKVPTRHTLLWLVEQLAALKINEFQLYIENVFEFPGHADMYASTTPLTPDDLHEVDALCRRYHIDFVPSLTSLGHFDKILRLPRYRHLAEIEPAELQRRGIKTWSDDPWTLCVTDPDAKALLTQMYAEFLPHFSSPNFNICCDESWDLGLGRSAATAKTIGVGGLYVQWVKFCCELAARHGKRVQLWGDIILNHPELIHELPENATLLEWGYAGDHPFDEHGKLFAQSRRAFYVCPGTSTWQSLGGRWDNAAANLRNAAHGGLKHGAAGFLNTDWGDYGHQQMLTVSLLPMAYGAAVAWNAQQDSADKHRVAAALQLLGDRAGTIVPALQTMGNIYQRITKEPLPNASLDFKLMREPWHDREFLNLAKAESLDHEYKHLAAICSCFEHPADTLNPQQALALRELAITRDQILYTLTRTTARLDFFATGKTNRATSDQQIQLLEAIKVQYGNLWLQRNKPSRLEDILAIFDHRLSEHRENSATASKKVSGTFF